MASDMITLGTSSGTVFPLACEAEVISALSTNVIVAEMIVKSLGVREGLCAFEPLALVGRGRVESESGVRRARRGRG
jgi:hypothetical protein